MGDTLVMEGHEMRGPRGEMGTFRNRAFMNRPDGLVIISDVLPEGTSERIRLGEGHNERRM